MDFLFLRPVNALIQVSVHLSQQNLQPLLGLLRRQVIELLSLLPGAEDSLVIKSSIMLISGSVTMISRTVGSIGDSL